MRFLPLALFLSFATLANPAPGGVGRAGASRRSARVAATSPSGPVWSPIGPEGGPIQSIVVAPSEPSLVYSATPYGGVFRSSDGGVSWQRPSAGIPESYGVVGIAVDAADPSIVYALTRDASPVLKSTDGGEHWTALETAPPDFAFGLRADPNRGGVLFAHGLGVSVSDDGGESWQERNHGFGCPTPDGLPEISALEVAPSDSSVVYAGTAAASVCRDAGSSATFYRSTDAGAHWSATAFPAGTGPVNAIAVAPADPDSVLAATASGLFRSADAGSSWTAASGLAVNVTAAAWSAVDPARAFASASEFEPSGATVETFYRSVDGGATWQAIASSSNEFVSVIASTRAGTVLTGFRRSGVFRSGDDGETWAFSNAGIRAVPLDSIAVAPALSSRIWAGTADGRVFRSDDGGGSWTRTALDAAENVKVFPDARRSSVVYAAVTSYLVGPEAPLGRLFKSVDAGTHWTEVDDGLGGLPMQIAVDPSNPDVVYASGGAVHEGRGAFKSPDGGATWTRLDTAAIETHPYDVFGEITIDPRDPQRLFMSSWGGLDRSEDGGGTWTVVDPGTTGSALVLDDESATVLLASRSGVWRSVDHGDHWTLSGRGVIAWSLSESAGRSRPVYASGGSGQAYESTDAGATWTPLGLDGVPDEVSVEIVSNGRRLFAASYAGLYAAPVPPLVVPAAARERPPVVKGR